MNITLEEQIEYMRMQIAFEGRMGYPYSESFAAILATLEACRDEKTACKPMSDPSK